MVESRHKAHSIAAFLLQVSRDYGPRHKTGLVRTDGASTFVAAGGVLGDIARCVVSGAEHKGGTDGPPAASRRLQGRQKIGDSNDAFSRAPGGGGVGGSICEDASARRGGNSRVMGASSGVGQDGASAATDDNSDLADEEVGDGGDLPDAGSDREDGAEIVDASGAPCSRGVAVHQRDGGSSGRSRVCNVGGELEDMAAIEARANKFCSEVPSALQNGAWMASDGACISSLSSENARCATNTLQLSVTAGLSVPTVHALLLKVRLVSRIFRKSKNFQ